MNGVGEDLARTVAWLSQKHELVVRTATVISQTWPNSTAPGKAADQADLYPSGNVAGGISAGQGDDGASGAGSGAGAASPTKYVEARRAFYEWLDAEMKAAADSARATLLDAGVPKEMLDAEQPAMVYSEHSETSRLIAAGEEFEADVMLLGSREDAPEGRYRAGSTADALLHCSPLPLLLVPRGLEASKRGPTRVNCAYVDTEQSQQALRHAADLARRWDVPLRLLAFSPDGVSLEPTHVAYGEQGVGVPLADAWRTQASELLERGRKRALARHPELEVTRKVGMGSTWSEAISSIKWRKGDLLVTGSSLLGEFNRVFIGPSTNQILRHVPVPVFLSTV